MSLKVTIPRLVDETVQITTVEQFVDFIDLDTTEKSLWDRWYEGWGHGRDTRPETISLDERATIDENGAVEEFIFELIAEARGDEATDNMTHIDTELIELVREALLEQAPPTQRGCVGLEIFVTFDEADLDEVNRWKEQGAQFLLDRAATTNLRNAVVITGV